MEINVTQSQDVTIVSPSGRLDRDSAPSLRAHCQELTASGNSRIIVDLAEVPFTDSAGLSALIYGIKLTRAIGGNLRIARAQAATLLVISLSSLERVLHPYPTVEEAQADL